MKTKYTLEEQLAIAKNCLDYLKEDSKNTKTSYIVENKFTFSLRTLGRYIDKYKEHKPKPSSKKESKTEEPEKEEINLSFIVLTESIEIFKNSDTLKVLKKDNLDLYNELVKEIEDTKTISDNTFKKISELNKPLKTLVDETNKALTDIGYSITDSTFTVPNKEHSYSRVLIEIANRSINNGHIAKDRLAKAIYLFLDSFERLPSFSVQNQLIGFLDYNNILFNELGEIIAYKAVNSNFTDKYSGKIDNSPNSSPEVPRNKVDDDCNRTCSYGLHAGNASYVKGFGNSNDKYIKITIKPENVVAVPTDYNNTKMRVCKYFVEKEVTLEEIQAESQKIGE